MPTREELLRREYLGRIERVIDHVFAHYGDELSVDELADVAAFSRFHFHRVFAGVVGETVSDFVKRIRLDRAAVALIDHPLDAVTDIALECGFSGPSVFARAFRERFGMAASEWRKLGRDELGKRRRAMEEEHRSRLRSGRTDGQARGRESTGLGTDGEALSTASGEPGGSSGYDSGIPILARRNAMEKLEYRVRVEELPEMTVAYARHVGPYDGIGEAFGRLARWAGPRGHYARPDMKSLAIYHDSPEVTEPAKLRSSACVTVPPGTEVAGDINLMGIPGGKYAIAHFEIRPDQFKEAWDLLMGEWFPSSGWQPDDRPCFEVYLNDQAQHPEKKFIIDICQPVKPL
jgi:AraC family transcriptional regulator